MKVRPWVIGLALGGALFLFAAYSIAALMSAVAP